MTDCNKAARWKGCRITYYASPVICTLPNMRMQLTRPRDQWRAAER
jgi:hypothetical protein